MDKKRIGLCIASFLSQFSICMANFALIYYMREHYGLSSSHIGIASSIYTVTYFIACLLFSRLFSHLKRAVKVFIAFFGMASTIFSILFFDNAYIMYLSLALYGMAMSFLWPNVEDWITEGLESKELNKATNAFNFSWSLGAGLSTMAAGFLSELSISLPIAISIFLFLMIMAFLILLAKSESGEKIQVEKDKIDKDNSTKLRYFAWMGNLLNYTCYALIINIFPLYALEQLGYSESVAGTLLLFRGISTCLSFILFTRFKFWQFNKHVIILSQFSLSLLFILFSYLKSVYSLALFFIAFGLLFALLYEMSIFHGASGAKNREQRMIIHEVLLNIGSVLGSSLGGIIYEIYSFSAILYMLATLALIFALIETSILFFSSKKGIRL